MSARRILILLCCAWAVSGAPAPAQAPAGTSAVPAACVAGPASGCVTAVQAVIAGWRAQGLSSEELDGRLRDLAIALAEQGLDDADYAQLLEIISEAVTEEDLRGQIADIVVALQSGDNIEPALVIVRASAN